MTDRQTDRQTETDFQICISVPLSLFYIFHLNLLNWFHFLILEGGVLIILIDCMIFSVTIPRCYKDVYFNNFFPRSARLWNFLPVERFPLINDLNGFKSRINRHLLTVGSF